MKQYLDLIEDILIHGEKRDDRTGVGTISVFGRQLRFDIQKGFPAVTTKSLAWKSVVSELLWFLEGSTNEHRLAEIKNDNKPYVELTEKERKTIWTLNAENQGKDLGYTNGDLGPVYGGQWRSWIGMKTAQDFIGTDRNDNALYNCFYYVNTIDQITNVINEIKNNPTSRRLLVNAWNVSELKNMALPPCHYGFQFYVDGKYLSLMWNQRSVDTMLGLPFNIASYGLLLNIIAKMTGKIPCELICSLGDCHIYNNHLDGAREQLKRSPHRLPTLKMPDIDYQNLSIDEVVKAVKTSDFVLENYEHDDTIKMAMAV